MESLKEYEHIIFYLGLGLVLLSSFFLSGFFSLLVSMLGLGLIVFGTNDDDK